VGSFALLRRDFADPICCQSTSGARHRTPRADGNVALLEEGEQRRNSIIKFFVFVVDAYQLGFIRCASSSIVKSHAEHISRSEESSL
jgi:hypothetical protein